MPTTFAWQSLKCRWTKARLIRSLYHTTRRLPALSLQSGCWNWNQKHRIDFLDSSSYIWCQVALFTFGGSWPDWADSPECRWRFQTSKLGLPFCVCPRLCCSKSLWSCLGLTEGRQGHGGPCSLSWCVWLSQPGGGRHCKNKEQYT